MDWKRAGIGTLLLVSLFTACGDGGGDDEVKLSSIAVTPDQLSVVKGLQGQLTATGTWSDGVAKDLTAEVVWRSSDEEVATVSAGAIVSVATGTATITARHAASGVEGSASVTVTRARAVTLSVAPAEVTVDYLDPFPVFAAEGELTDGSLGDVTADVDWTADTSIATVAGGVVTPVKRGTTAVVATEPGTGATDSATLVVTNAVKFTGMEGLVECHPNFCTVPYAWTYRCAVWLDDDALVWPPNASLVWSTSNPTAAAVDGQGRVTFTAYGTYEIVATLPSGLACRITTILHPD